MVDGKTHTLCWDWCSSGSRIGTATSTTTAIGADIDGSACTYVHEGRHRHTYGHISLKTSTQCLFRSTPTKPIRHEPRIATRHNSMCDYRCTPHKNTTHNDPDVQHHFPRVDLPRLQSVKRDGVDHQHAPDTKTKQEQGRGEDKQENKTAGQQGNGHERTGDGRGTPWLLGSCTKSWKTG